MTELPNTPTTLTLLSADEKRVLAFIRSEAADFKRVASKWDERSAIGREHQFTGDVLDRVANDIERGDHRGI